MSDSVTRTDNVFSSEEAVEMGVVSIKDIQRSLFQSTLGRPRFVRLGQPDHPSLQVAILSARAVYQQEPFARERLPSAYSAYPDFLIEGWTLDFSKKDRPQVVDLLLQVEMSSLSESGCARVWRRLKE